MSAKNIYTLHGDLYTPWNRVKYLPLFQELNAQIGNFEYVNGSLGSFQYMINLFLSFQLNSEKWTEKSYKTNYAFDQRSKNIAKKINKTNQDTNFIFQNGVLFNSVKYAPHQNLVLYTDYTSALSKEKKEAGRSPLNSNAYQKWFNLEKQTYQQSQLIFTRSNQTRDSIIDTYAIQPEKVITVGAGVNPDMLKQTAERKPEHRFNILFIGKELYRKGGDIVLQSYQQLKEKYPHIQLYMVTSDPLPKQFTAPDIHWIEPTWDRNKIRYQYQNADLFVLPSRLETWGDVLLEAMAQAVPCIGVSADAMPEIIEDGKTGYIVCPEDPRAFANAIEKMITNPQKCRQMGNQAYQHLKQNFTWQATVQKMLPHLSIK
jgi:glycosyltransferase involved in cell wall biosynthesis